VVWGYRHIPAGGKAKRGKSKSPRIGSHWGQPVSMGNVTLKGVGRT
jgi:hypothetical protein